jgi:bifunctional DNA-binding transcriptional regulator/antitoxin component of YhaV-PrlF toxin-antitoxin module
MGLLANLKGISDEVYNNLTVIVGMPGSGKTTLAGTYPKPMLYVSVGADGGSVVLKHYGDENIKVLPLERDNTPIYTKMTALFDELLTTKHGFKTILVDAYSSVEEDLVGFMEAAKKKKLNLDERGDVGEKMLRLRDKIVKLSRQDDAEVVLVCHIKTKEATDNITGKVTKNYIPKMTENNGIKLLERASNAMYCARKTVMSENGLAVKFVTFIGAHPNINTKFRSEHKPSNVTGYYVSDCSYDKIQKIRYGKVDFACDVVEQTITNTEGEIE